ncbi:MAG: hypothetical protein IJ002_04740 [Clostridia bacterium]|nr:hypothetical protein [Clostridia bacterium]
MRRKLISLLLCFLMALSTVAFTACGENEDGEGTSEEPQSTARAAVSVNMWVVCEKEVDAETEALVEEAFNDLTESKYTTHVDLKFYTMDEYFEILDAELEKAANIKASNTVIDMPILIGGDSEAEETAEETIVEETVIGEYGEKKILYPEIEEGQVDIVFLAGEELLERYVSEGKLLSLEEKLNSSDAKVLKDYIYPSAINQIKVSNGGSVAQAYAIPNNAIIGEYTYLLVNKEMAEKYYIDVDEINSFADCAALIADIGKNESDIAPVLAYADPVNMEYWLDFATDEEADTTFTFSVGSTDANVFGAKRTLPAAPAASGNTVMVPLEFFSEALDASYAFKSATSVATVTYGTRVIAFEVGSASATVNGETARLSAAVYTDDETGEVMAPVDFIAEKLCATVTYDEAQQQYVIEAKDFGGLSLLASYIGADSSLGDYVKMDSAFNISEFTDHMLLMQTCKDKGWFAEDSENADDFGVAIVTGSYEDMAAYSDKYSVKVLSYPTLDDEDVYDAMFAVTAYTTDLSRSLEVLSLIYTDEEAKNILQYGVEGVHYEFDDDGNFLVISDKYCMNNNYTGNAFLAYTTADMPADIWENAKATNLDSRVYPFFGLDDAWSGVGANHISTLRKISNVFFDEMEECNNSTELAEFFKDAQTLIFDNETFQTAIGNVPEVDPATIIPGEEVVEDTTTPYAVYSQWGAANWSVEAKAEAEADLEAMKASAEETAEETTVETVE